MYDLFGGDYGQTTNRPSGATADQAHFSAGASGDTRGAEWIGEQKGTQSQCGDRAGVGQGDEGKEAQGGVAMFWKKQQPALRMVKGELMPSSPHTYVLRLVVKKMTTNPQFCIEWNGEPFSIYFEGFGYITVLTVPHFAVSQLRTILIQHHAPDGVRSGNFSYRDYHKVMQLDILERHIQEETKELFIAHGIDPQSYSLDELRIAGYGMERGWKLRDEYEKAKRDAS